MLHRYIHDSLSITTAVTEVAAALGRQPFALLACSERQGRLEECSEDEVRAQLARSSALALAMAFASVKPGLRFAR
jgi:hypothetical protein